MVVWRHGGSNRWLWRPHHLHGTQGPRFEELACRLTRRSSGHTTAGYVYSLRPSRRRRCVPLNSNVRRLWQHRSKPNTQTAPRAQKAHSQCRVYSRRAVRLSPTTLPRATSIFGTNGGPSRKAGSSSLHQLPAVVEYPSRSARTAVPNSLAPLPRHRTHERFQLVALWASVQRAGSAHARSAGTLRPCRHRLRPCHNRWSVWPPHQ
jgi:hypothetical protein